MKPAKPLPMSNTRRPGCLLLPPFMQGFAYAIKTKFMRQIYGRFPGPSSPAGFYFNRSGHCYFLTPDRKLFLSANSTPGQITCAGIVGGYVGHGSHIVTWQHIPPLEWIFDHGS